MLLDVVYIIQRAGPSMWLSYQMRYSPSHSTMRLKFCCLGSKFCDIFLIDFLSFNTIPSLIPILLVDILSLTLIYFQLIIHLGDWQILMLIETFNVPTSTQGRYLDTCPLIFTFIPLSCLFNYALILCFIHQSFWLLVNWLFFLFSLLSFSMWCYRMLFI